jgi:hypothetical protein
VTLIATAEPEARHQFATLAECFSFLQHQAATSDTCVDEPLPLGAPTATTESTSFTQGLYHEGH